MADHKPIKRKDRNGIEYRDYPFDDVVAKARELTEQGHEVYQKFSCAGCGARVQGKMLDKFDEEGRCDQCGTITNIKKRGCNYMVRMMMVVGDRAKKPTGDNDGDAADKQGQGDDQDRVQETGRGADGD